MSVSTTTKNELVKELLQELKPGDTLYSVLRSVSRSGMSRVISTKSIKLRDGGADIRQYDYAIQELLGLKMHNYEGNKIGGGGMDMGFSIVYNLSRELFHDGFECIGSGCPSNDHSNGDRDYTPHHHEDGGYALRQRWL